MKKAACACFLLQYSYFFNYLHSIKVKRYASSKVAIPSLLNLLLETSLTSFPSQTIMQPLTHLSLLLLQTLLISPTSAFVAGLPEPSDSELRERPAPRFAHSQDLPTPSDLSSRGIEVESDALCEARGQSVCVSQRCSNQCGPTHVKEDHFPLSVPEVPSLNRGGVGLTLVPPLGQEMRRRLFHGQGILGLALLLGLWHVVEDGQVVRLRLQRSICDCERAGSQGAPQHASHVQQYLLE